MILEAMKKNDKFIGDLLAPFEQALGIKFNKFERPEDPKYVEPKKKVNLRLNLKKAERKQEKLKKMDPSKANEIRWKDAIDRAQGVKIKDDPKMIRKAIKRKDAEKKKHRKKWAERLEGREKAKQLQQEKKARKSEKVKEAKKAKKIKKRR